MSYRVRDEATIGAFGDLETDRSRYRPLDPVVVRIKGRDAGDDCCRVKVHDAKLRVYFEAEHQLSENQGIVTFKVAGAPGIHWIYLYFGEDEHHSRYANFLMECETTIETGNEKYDRLYPITKEAMQLGRRDFALGKGRFVGYISGDTWAINGVWLRDWIYQLSAYRYWEREMSCGLDRFLELQNPDGSFPDGLKRDGSTWRADVESDVEYIMVLGVWSTWRITGDDAWLLKVLPHLEKALDYVENNEWRWDREYQLVKRGHTCDTWDFEIGETSGFVGKRFVIATCDQSGYYLAYRAMAEMFRHLNRKKRADNLEEKAEDYRRRVNDLLWDGGKYLHHVHLTPVEHPGFDEREQLAMGNVWAITRTLANHSQAISIINEYRRRHQETGDAFPWWSLQPGYPDQFEYFQGDYCQQGGYANGGLMPWVGGELCRACFEHGMELYGLELYHQYIEHLHRTHNRVHVWYWPNGQAGFRTTNEVPYTGWGMAQWLSALLEGLAGLKDTTKKMRMMEVAPRWAVTSEREVYAAAHYPAGECYFAYRMRIDSLEKIISLEYSGSGQEVQFHLLLPENWHPQSVSLNRKALRFQRRNIERSLYLDFSGEIAGLRKIEIICS